MSAPHEILAEVRRWITKAENDLRNAEYVLTLPENCHADTVCFHAHQGAEKYLKALLVYRQVSFPKTHDLVVLLNLLQAESKPDLQAQDILPLNRYPVEARYPGTWDPIDVQDARAAVAMARKVRSAVRARLAADLGLEGE